MIGKVKIGRSFGSIYHHAFQENRQAQVLDAEGVRTDSLARRAADFQFQQAQRPGLGNARRRRRRGTRLAERVKLNFHQLAGVLEYFCHL